MAASETIAIVGAGFSGSLLAVQLLRRGGSVVLIERSGVFGLGLAYGTTCPQHLLNVRSGRMSAFPDDPGHFVRWLEASEPHLADPEGFAPRMVYGRYVQALLDDVAADAGDRFRRVSAEVTAVRADAVGATVALAGGGEVKADRAVLAIGNRPPDTPDRAFAAVAPDRYLNDPWAPGALDQVKPADEVLMIGTGLTMIDVMLALEAQGWVGRGLAMSRRGLLPRPHDETQAHAAPDPLPDASVSGRLSAFRQRLTGRHWGEAMDQIRPFNQALWRAAEPAERKRFLRHLRPWWDVHRHRVATGVARAIEAMFDTGQVGVAGGKIVKVEPHGAGVMVDWRPRGSTDVVHARYDRVINCTGPLMDLSHSNEALPRQLFDEGVARPDPLRIGLDVDGQGRVLDAQGRANPRLWAIGPLTRAEAWETVAVPEIRGQAAELAERLAGD